MDFGAPTPARQFLSHVGLHTLDRPSSLQGWAGSPLATYQIFVPVGQHIRPVSSTSIPPLQRLGTHKCRCMRSWTFHLIIITKGAEPMATFIFISYSRYFPFLSLFRLVCFQSYLPLEHRPSDRTDSTLDILSNSPHTSFAAGA